MSTKLARKADKPDIRLTRKQERYLEEILSQVQTGQVLSDKATAEKLGIARQTVSGWYQDSQFRAEASRILRGAVRLRDQLVDMAVQREAMRGNMKAAELNLRRRGLMDGPLPQMEGAGPATPGGYTVNVIGLPMPPTREEAERRRPPVGSNVIMPPTLPPGVTMEQLQRRPDR